MLQLLQVRRKHVSDLPSRSVRPSRPSLLDLRFTGDPWIEADGEGVAALCLANFRLAAIALLPLDLPSFNDAFHRLRGRLSARPRCG
jgi:hypothetical protein